MHKDIKLILILRIGKLRANIMQATRLHIQYDTLLTTITAYSLRSPSLDCCSCTEEHIGRWSLYRWHNHVQRKYLLARPRPATFQGPWPCHSSGRPLLDWRLGSIGFRLQRTSASDVRNAVPKFIRYMNASEKPWPGQ